jgi:hypothetical protein
MAVGIQAALIRIRGRPQQRAHPACSTKCATSCAPSTTAIARSIGTCRGCGATSFSTASSTRTQWLSDIVRARPRAGCRSCSRTPGIARSLRSMRGRWSAGTAASNCRKRSSSSIQTRRSSPALPRQLTACGCCGRTAHASRPPLSAARQTRAKPRPSCRRNR